MENVITDKAKEWSGSVFSTNCSDRIPVKSGFNRIPARMYPEIYGSLIFSTASPRRNPEKIKVPIASMVFTCPYYWIDSFMK
jgi:hypothetical protein